MDTRSKNNVLKSNVKDSLLMSMEGFNLQQIMHELMFLYPSISQKNVYLNQNPKIKINNTKKI